MPSNRTRIALLLIALALSSCATSEEVRLRMRVKELEQDRADLIEYAARQQQYIHQLQGGMELQARIAANLRYRCDT